MKTGSIKNIIFDLGGVLLRIDYKRTENAFIGLGCKNFREIYSQAAQTRLFDLFETGQVVESDFFEELKNLSGLNYLDIAELKKAWNAMLLEFPQASHKLLNEVNKKYRVFLLSNNNYTHVIHYQKLIEKVCPVPEFESLFEKVYYSYRMGLKKPDEACFMHVLQQNNLNPQETLFIDDSVQHVKGAGKTGIMAHWLETPMTTRDFLEQKGLI